MTNFILVHGAFHGGWCWDRIKPLLEARGHMVYAPDLPSHGDDNTPPEKVSLNDYVSCIGEILQKVKGKSVIIGHSLGGITITQVGETYYEYISQLIYLAAAVPANGQCRADLTSGNEQSLLNSYRITSENGKLFTVLAEGVKPTFYADCDDQTIEWVKTKLSPQPAIILETPVVTTVERWGRLPRAYIHCTEDKAIMPASQNDMCQRHTCDPVVIMNTSHSPFLSAPAELVRNISNITA